MKTDKKTGTHQRRAARKASARGAKTTSSPREPAATKLVKLAGPPTASKANPVQARTLVSGMKGKARRFQKAEGEQAHEFGTLLAWMFRGSVHTLYGYEDFVSFVEQELGISPATMYRYLAVAKYATAEQSVWGVTAVLAAGQLVELLRGDAALRRRVKLANAAPKTIEDIAEVEFPLPGEGTLLLQGPLVAAPDVRAAIACLLEGTVPTEDLPLVLRRKNESLRTECAANEQLEGVKARYEKKRGKQELRVTIPRGADVRAVFAALAKVLVD